MEGITLVVFMLALCGAQAEIRPLYVAGFMANSISDVDSYLDAGANVIEADLQFDKNSGHATEFYKGLPCDCFRLCHKRESVINYFEHIREITTPDHPKYKPNFTGILLIDAGLSSTSLYSNAGRDMARLLDMYLFSNENKAKVVFDLSDIKYFPFLDSLIQNLKERMREDIILKIGIAATTGEYYNEFITKASDLDVGLWMGDGVTNCLEDFFSLTDVKKACELRDKGHGVSKVIRWTVDYRRNIRNALQLGVDVIGTNDVHDVWYVVREKEFRTRYRMARDRDDPFRKVKGYGARRYGCHSASIFNWSLICWKDKDIKGNWCNVNMDCTKDAGACDGAVNLPCTSM